VIKYSGSFNFGNLLFEAAEQANEVIQAIRDTNQRPCYHCNVIVDMYLIISNNIRGLP
jgi:hypothetical protein